MRWEDAPYVRLYIEPDPLFAALPWQARALWHELLKVVSRTGELTVGQHDPSRDVTDGHAKSRRVLAVLVRMPVEVVTDALQALLEDGCLLETDTSFVIPNYLAAQMTARTPAARKREERERQRDTSMSRAVTNSHAASRKVTLEQSSTEQSRAEQSRISTRATRAPARPRADRVSVPDFDEFWTAYPRKVGKDAARRAWLSKTPPLAACLAALTWQRESEQWQRDNGQFIPHPATWINQGRWADEPAAAPAARGNAAWQEFKSGEVRL